MSDKMVVKTVPQSLALYCEDMTAEKAGIILSFGLKAIAYLEESAAKSVDADYHAAKPEEGKHVDASEIFFSQRDKMKVSKSVKAVTSTLLFCEEVHKWEIKQQAINTTATKADAKLPAPASK